MAIQNPFSGAAALGTMSRMAQFNPLANAGQRLGDIAQLNQRDNLAELMQNNGGQVNNSMSPTAMLATPDAQKFFTGQQTLGQGDRRLDMTEAQHKNSNALGWANHNLSKKKFNYSKKDQFMLDMKRMSDVQSTFNSGYQDALDVGKGDQYMKDNGWMIYRMKQKMMQYKDGGYVDTSGVSGSGASGTPSVGGSPQQGQPQVGYTPQVENNAWNGTGLYTGGQQPQMPNQPVPQQPSQTLFQGDDADSGSYGGVGVRANNFDAREVFHGQALDPSNQKHVQSQMQKYGYGSLNDLYAQGNIDSAALQLAGLGYDKEAIAELTGHMPQPNTGDVVDYAANFPDVMNLKDVDGKNYDYEVPIENSTFKPDRHGDGSLQKGKYGRVLGDLQVGGRSAGEILQQNTGLDDYNPHKKAQENLIATEKRVEKRGSKYKGAKTADMVYGSADSPKRAYNNGFTKSDIDLLKEKSSRGMEYRDSIVKQGATEVTNAAARGVQVPYTIKKLGNAIDALPKDSAQRKKLEALRGNLMDGLGSKRSIQEKQTAELEAASKDQEGLLGAETLGWNEDTYRGTLTDVADTLSKLGLDFPGMVDNYKDLTNPDVYNSLTAAYIEVTGRAFSWKDFADMTWNASEAKQGGFSDIRPQENSNLAQILEKTVQAYDIRTRDKGQYKQSVETSDAVSELTQNIKSAKSGKMNLMPNEVAPYVAQQEEKIKFAQSTGNQKVKTNKERRTDRKVERIKTNKDLSQVQTGTLDNAISGKGGLFDLLGLDEQGNRKEPLQNAL